MKAVFVFCSLAISFPARASISFETGVVSGTVLTNAGAPVASTSVRAQSLSSSGSAEAACDAGGAYSLTLPTGSYLVTAQYQGNAVGTPQNVTVVAATTTTANFSFAAGTVHVIITRNGAPALSAAVILASQPPACNAPGASCSSDPMGNCYCTLDGQQYFCSPTGVCNWMMPQIFRTFTDASGQAAQLLPAGAWALTGSSAPVPTQFGDVTLSAPITISVADGSDFVAAELDYTTGQVGGHVTIGGVTQPGTMISAQAGAPLGGTIDTASDASGAWSLDLPSGSYQLSAALNGAPVSGAVSVTVTASSSQVVDFNQPGGFLTGTVTRDGGPAAAAGVTIVEQAPACNAPGATCTSDPMGNCFCSISGRQYFCSPSGGCQFMTPSFFRVFTDAAGAFSQLVPPGAYGVAVFSAPEANQFGDILLRQDSVAVLDGQVTPLGDTSYSTGTMSGVLTSCGGPLQGAAIRIDSTTPGAGSVTTAGTGAAYSLRLPVGSYNANLLWNSAAETTSPVAVSAGATTDFSPNFDLGQLRGLILANGLPAAGSSAVIVEQAPACNAPGATCITDGMGKCNCTLGGRQYFCSSSGSCNWMMPLFQRAFTGVDGFFTATLPPTDYDVQAFSPNPSGQFGSILVGTVASTVQACQLAEIGASGASLAAGSNVPVNLGDGVTLNFSTVASPGSVSYIATSTPEGPPPPSGAVEFVGLFYDFTVGAAFSGTVQVCLPWDAEEVPSGSTLALYHNVGGTWVDITTSVDTVSHVVCGSTTSFSLYVVGVSTNRPPVANAGPAQHVNADANCEGLVTLDGSASSDPDGAIASYRWSYQGNVLGSGAQLQVSLAPGSYQVQLAVTDSGGLTSTATTTVTVLDVTPPLLSLAVSPSLIWPPSGAMTQVTPSYTVSDNCDPAPKLTLVGVSANDLAPASDMQLQGLDALVRATRFGSDSSGRTYTLQYRALDASGNASYATPGVLVPHDQRKQ
jgi:hypothetical protein